MTDQKSYLPSHLPTTFVVLGVTGDLMTKKIAPALFNLHERGLLPPHFRLVGVSRRDWKDDDLKRHIQAILEVRVKNASPASVASFLKTVVYHKITFDAYADYVALGDALRKIDDEHGQCSNKLFYLSVPPQFYSEIFTNIHKARLTELCDAGAGGWTRVVVEKPFGGDEKSAKALDERIARLFKEEQVYRIDHYLAKETLQNILTFRFVNNLFEDDWGRDLIEKINIRELENVGAEDRGPFYESVGAFRDVGQNHLLEMIALVTMDQPRDMSADAIRSARAAILETIKPITPSEMSKKMFRAQYDGYRGIKGVDPKSDVETYFKVALELTHPRWKGVPIFIEAGKRIIHPKRNEEVTEIEVIFKHDQPCLCALYGAGAPGTDVPIHFKNSILFRQDPQESITIHFWAKKPGLAMELEERVFTIDLRQGERKSQYTEEYEKLLLDCINGDQTLFVSSREVVAMWHFVDPIVKGWAKGLVPLRRYAPDSEAVVAEATTLLDPPESVEESKGGFGTLRREIGIFGLGKMGANVARQLHEKGWRVVASNRSPGPVEIIQKEGIQGVFTHAELVAELKSPRIVWIMITAGKGNDDLLFGEKGSHGESRGIVQHLKKGDIIIDAANAFYEDTMRRAKLLKKRGIHFMDVGFSGGPTGARNGGSLMIGGERDMFQRLEPLFRDLSVPGGYSYFGAAGAGHFVKMVHNGIEYGMMQSLAEGFALMKKSPFKLDLEQVAEVYNRGSVIESKLVGWLGEAYKMYGQDLKSVSGSVAYTGEGEWTVKTGKKLKVPVQVIENSFKFRIKSKKSPSYIGKILSALRNRFGGHAIDQGKGK